MLSVRRIAVTAAALLALLALPASASAAAPKPKKVKPVIECVIVHDNGTYTASIGYLSEYSYTVDLPAGTARNEFTPSPDDRGQPDKFKPGRNPHAFKVTVPTSVSLRWTLDGDTVVAHPAYTSPCVGSGSMTGNNVRTFWGRGATRSGIKAWFSLPCDPTKPRRLEVWWNQAGRPYNKFQLSSVNYTFCWNDPIIDPGRPWAGFDSSLGLGVGMLNGKVAIAEWYMVDRGERSDHRYTGRWVDRFGIAIRDASNRLVLAKDLLVKEGNVESNR